jgi:hypothetical protein
VNLFHFRIWILHNAELPKHWTCNGDVADTMVEYHRPENVVFQVEAACNVEEFHTLVRPQVEAVAAEVLDSQNWGQLG